jgi:D-alanyl-D-alanine carboxypeptidase/D-alanyl-D-alanine-endopeptidase (penicillin-binding protein 4)
MARIQLQALLVSIAVGTAAPAPPARADGELGARVGAFIRQPEYRQARWGILAVDAETGRTVYEHNAEQLFLPASTTKLFSCAAALAAFGPDYRFETPVYRRGSVSEGRLEGDLILVAKGDPTLGGRTDAAGRMAYRNHDHIYAGFLPGAELTDTDPLAGLKELARQVARSGIRGVAGEVLVDDRMFPRSRGSGSGPDVLTPIVLNDNLMDVLVTPAEKAGEPARVEVRPPSACVQIDARVETVAVGQAAHAHADAAGPLRYVVRGEIPVKAKPAVLILAVEDPTAFARALFIEALRAEGVDVGASALRGPAAALPPQTGYGELPRVALFTSPPFSELIKVTLKVSHNLYASMLPILVSAKDGPGTVNDGLRRQRGILEGLGVPVETVSFGGGAGGSSADAVTPRATVELLRGMARRPECRYFLEGLPVLGMDGTLAEAVGPDSPARGKVRAKTGTLVWHDAMNDRSLLTSKAIAGTLTTAAGRELIFAVFVNGVPLPKGVNSTREGKALGKLCEIFVEHVP